jgi:uncharacterized protein DUF2794
VARFIVCLMSVIRLHFSQAPRHKAAKPSLISFTRPELDEILRLYGFFVAANEWRDYAIDSLKDAAVFSVFRRASEMPLYRIEKNPGLARRQGAFAVVAMGGQVLKCGSDLRSVLRVFDKQKLKLVK